MKLYYVYMLLCADRSFYIGITNDVELRVAQHQIGYSRTCYTFKRLPVKLVYSSEFPDVNDAIAAIVASQKPVDADRLRDPSIELSKVVQ